MQHSCEINDEEGPFPILWFLLIMIMETEHISVDIGYNFASRLWDKALKAAIQLIAEAPIWWLKKME
jgi:hypothetical protein